MFEVILSGADAFEWGCDLTLNAETMTCDVMLKTKTMTCDLLFIPFCSAVSWQNSTPMIRSSGTPLSSQFGTPFNLLRFLLEKASNARNVSA
jgi:hypothetical protein